MARPTVAERDRLQAKINSLEAAARKGSTGLTINLDGVPVVGGAAYVDLTYATDDFESPRLYNVGNKQLILTLACGDKYLFNGEKLGEAVMQANLLPSCKEDDAVCDDD